MRLIRVPNLLIIAATQYSVRYFLLLPNLNMYKFDLQLSEGHFFLLVLATVMIAAAGYVINDYFDVKTDSINKPEKLIIDITIKRRVAMAAHLVMSIIAIAIGFYIAMIVGNWKLGAILFFASGLLWVYSAYYKKQFLTGNIIVSLLSAMVILIVVMFERNIYTVFLTRYEANSMFIEIVQVALAFAILAFFVSLIREIVKDMEDVEGDRSIYSKTLPIKLGIRKTKWVVGSLIIVLMGLIGLSEINNYLNGFNRLMFYSLAFVQLPLAFLFILLIRPAIRKHFHTMSVLVKVIMLAGILGMLIYEHNFWVNLDSAWDIINSTLPFNSTLP
ncbi:MAG: geranylgeranylglycerol-phosphate geranylgeranyltransferase [Bacteroidetes bacterium]|nr:geranylgeranylglycerol-phosphate geranylgeranyltransferase [Bacteroidota bacterium]